VEYIPFTDILKTMNKYVSILFK